MSKTFEEWKDGLDTKSGDKILTESGELVRCGNEWFYVHGFTAPTKAIFLKRGFPVDGRKRLIERVECGDVLSDHAFCASIWSAEPEQSELKSSFIEQAAREWIRERGGPFVTNRVTVFAEGTPDGVSPIKEHEGYVDSYVAGARSLLGKAKEMQFKPIHDGSPVVLISSLEKLFEDKQCSPT